MINSEEKNMREKAAERIWMTFKMQLRRERLFKELLFCAFLSQEKYVVAVLKP